jgi:hypothetical protein
VTPVSISFGVALPSPHAHKTSSAARHSLRVRMALQARDLGRKRGCAAMSSVACSSTVREINIHFHFQEGATAASWSVVVAEPENLEIVARLLRASQ